MAEAVLGAGAVGAGSVGGGAVGVAFWAMAQRAARESEMASRMKTRFMQVKIRAARGKFKGQCTNFVFFSRAESLNE
jgi:hypothetical protein